MEENTVDEGSLLLSCSTELKVHAGPTYEMVAGYKPGVSISSFSSCGSGTGESGGIRGASWCRNGAWTAVIPWQGPVEIICARGDVRLLQSVSAVTEPTAGAFQRTSKKYLALGTASGALLLYDVRSRSVRRTYAPGAGAAVSLLDWSAKDSHLAAGGADGRVTLYSGNTGQRVAMFSVPASRSVSALRFSPLQRAALALASDEGQLALYDTHAGRVEVSVRPHSAPVTDLAFSHRNHGLLATCALDRTCLFYDTRTVPSGVGGGAPVVTLSTDEPLSCLDLHRKDGVTLALGSTRGLLAIYDLRHYANPLVRLRVHQCEIRRLLYQPVVSHGDHSEVADVILPEEDVEPVTSAASTAVVTDSFTQLLQAATAATSRPDFSPRITTDFSDSRSEGGDFFQEFQPQNYENQETSCSATPINHESNSNNPSAVDELKYLVQDVVTRAVSEQISELMDTLNRHFLNLQLSFSKQFVCQEEQIEKLAQHSGGMIPEMLVELERLRQENRHLKDQMNRILKNPEDRF